MDKRIRNLAVKSGMNWMEEYTEGNDAFIVNESDIVKFAELIEQNIDFSKPYLSGKEDGRLETINECIEYLRNCGDISRALDLKQHFGIK